MGRAGGTVPSWMLLAIDVGNTHTSLGVFSGGSIAAGARMGDPVDAAIDAPGRAELRCELRLGTRRNWTRDEVAVSIRQILALAELDFSDIREAVVACVVPPALEPLVAGLEHHVGVSPLVVGPGVRTSMPIRYDPPQDVGADRIVTAVAAHHRYGTSPADTTPHGLVVVDFGTATTFDAVSPKPEYLGGVIAPGIGISSDALFARAAKLPRVEIVRPERVVGRNTVAALQSGLVFGYVGLVEGVLSRLREELAWPIKVIATGGFASILQRESDCIDVVDDALVLEGLRLIHTMNRRPD